MNKRLLVILSAALVMLICSSLVCAQNAGEGQMFIRKGEAAYNAGDYTAALAHMERALSIFEELKAEPYASFCHMIIGNIYLKLEKGDDAAVHFNKALEITRGIGPLEVIAHSKNGMGMVLSGAGRYAEALPYYEEAYELFARLGTVGNEWAAMENLVTTLEALGRHTEALPYLEKALSQARNTGDREKEALLLITIGRQYYFLGMYEDALPYYVESMSINGELNNRQGVGESINNIATVFWQLGRYTDALLYFGEALTLFRELNYREGLAANLTNSAAVLWEMGRYETALKHLEEGRDLYREIGKKTGEAGALNNIGEIYRNLGRYDKALSNFNEALTAYREMNDTAGAGTVLSNLGLVHMETGRNNEALSCLTEALDLKRKVGNRDSSAFTLNNIGLIYRDAGKLPESLPYFEEARDIFRETGNRKGLGIALRNVGTVSFGLGDYEGSLSCYRESYELARSIGHVDGRYLSAWGLGRAYLGRGDFDNSIKYYTLSIDALESIRGELSSEENRTSFIENKQAVYEELIRILIERGRADVAFNYVERARSRAFLDMLGTRNPTVADKRERGLLEDEEESRLELAGLSGGLENRDEGEGSETAAETRSVTGILRRQAEETLEKHRKLTERIEKRNPELASLITVNPLTLAEVQKLLPDGVRVVEYFITEDTLLIFSVGRDDFSVYERDVTRAELEKAVIGLREGITASLIAQGRTDLLDRSENLYKTLIAPIRGDLKGSAHTIIIIPHGPLHYLPFSCLYSGKKYLVDDFTLINDPSSSVLRFVAAKREAFGGRTIAFGNPKTEYSPLPNAEEEARDIGRLLKDVDVYTGESATETVGKANFSRYNTIHLACHGKFREDDPLASSLYLTADAENDGRLMVRELFGLDLSGTSLVVLSACETGLAKIMGGDELIGLSRGFIYAGTPSLVVSLWEIADDSTARFMVKFYEYLDAGLDKPDALRQAQLWLKSRREYESPFYWAAFEIVGDWQ